MKSLKGALAVSAALLALLGASAASARDVVVHAGRLIDGVSAAPRERVSILIHDGIIKQIDPGFVAPNGYEIVDLSRTTVLPGLIDCHVHLSIYLLNAPLLTHLVLVTPFDQAINSTLSARALLESGFTSARDVGGYTPVMVALKKAIAANKVEGPRLWIAGGVIAPTGGHGDYSNGLDPALHKPEWEDNIVSGPIQAIELVRERHKVGVDLIKIAVSGGMTSDGDNPNAQLMTDEEVKAIVDTAHTLGMKVAAHAHGKTAIDHASQLGVDSIEHGTFADAETFRIMKAKGSFLVPTLLAGEELAEFMRAHPEQLSPSAAQKMETLGRLTGRNVAEAYRGGVKIAFGTDTPGIGPNAKEFALLVKAGLPPMAAIQTATANAAELLGAADKVGTIQPGRYGDLIATTGDPLADISVLEHVEFVMKGGEVVKRSAAAGGKSSGQ